MVIAVVIVFMLLIVTFRSIMQSLILRVSAAAELSGESAGRHKAVATE